MNELARVLFVDDEPNVVAALSRQFAFDYEVFTANSGPEALDMIAAEGGFAAIVTDMRMPGMDGAELLQRVRDLAPGTTRLLLTGYADISAAMAAVNEGAVFRFLTKPCDEQVLTASLEAAVEQHRLVNAERELLEKTVRGSMQALADVLAMASPEIFGRAQRVQRHVRKVLEHMALDDRWYIEVATILAQLPAVTLPEDTLHRWWKGDKLSAAERAMVTKLPSQAERLAANIPRLDQVRAILRGLSERGAPQAPLDVAIIRACLELELRLSRGHSPRRVLATLAHRGYPAAIVEALTSCAADLDAAVIELQVSELRVGMVIRQDVHTRTGLVLVSNGHEITEGLLERLRNYSSKSGLVEPILVSTGEVVQTGEHETGEAGEADGREAVA